MRKAEWITAIAFCFFFLASWLRPVSMRRRMAIAAIGATGLLLLALVLLADQFLPQYPVTVARDILPALLMPMVYWQAGWLSGKINHGFQAKLQKLDVSLVSRWMPILAQPKYRWAMAILELAYISCYVLVPLGLLVLYATGLERHVPEYWNVSLLATYPCYAFTAFFPTTPPRILEKKPAATVTGKIRRFNLWVVRSFSTELNTFPSAHVTATLGSSLVLLHFLPGIGLVFVLVSIGIGLGAVMGRYHYAADVLLAAILTLAVYVLELHYFV